MAAGEGTVVLPSSVSAFYTRADVVHVPVSDVAPNRVGLVWAAGREAPLLAEFAGLAAERVDGGRWSSRFVGGSG
ncbi:hypothetical protein [Kitasatospora sp. NPDC017646]|uniref:hypothetical protein n=1 Tax=Kitasatospora sp. NPDC017646 TaxID=3364024 RepID=UPI0037B36F19